MSEDYRARLYGRVRNVSVTDFAPMRRGPGDVAYDACEMYDVDAAERALVETALFRRCPTMRAIQVGLDWATLDGTFCRRYEAAAVATKMSWNHNPFPRLETMRGQGVDTETRLQRRVIDLKAELAAARQALAAERAAG